MHRLLFLNNLRWWARLPIKWAVFGVTLLAICFPDPSRLIRHIKHSLDPNALIEPDAPAIAPLVAELRPRLSEDLSPQEVLQLVERYVYQRIPYEWDWNTWGSADYLPTVTEVIEMGKEDCDGRAVVAASLLRNFGFDARLVHNFAHMWVVTDQGATMSPGKTLAVVAEEGGLRIRAEALVELPKATAFGLAVFPLGRELIALAVLWFLSLRIGGGVYAGVGGLALLLAGLLMLRWGGHDYEHPTLWAQWLGVASFLTGIVVLFVSARLHARRRVDP